MNMQRFIKQSVIPAPPAVIFALHEQPDTIERLIPPWERVEILERPHGLRRGGSVVFKVYSGPFWRLWVAEHIAYEPPHLFADVQRRGPFSWWRHYHRFEPSAPGATLMTDEIEYALPFGSLGELVAGDFTRKKLQRMFDYRHRVVAELAKSIGAIWKRADGAMTLTARQSLELDPSLQSLGTF